MSPPWLELERVAPVHLTELVVTPGGCAMLYLTRPCPTTPFSPRSELRPPPQAPLRRVLTTPRPSVTSSGCARALGTHRASPRGVWTPEQETRRSPPSRPRRRQAAGGLGPADQGFDPPGSMTGGASPLLISLVYFNYLATVSLPCGPEALLIWFRY